MGYHDEYEATIDGKGRFLLPGGLKKQLPDGTDTLMITRSFEGCLLMYTMNDWALIEEKLKKLKDLGSKGGKAKTILGTGSVITIDAAGRMLLPASLKEFAKLDKDIMIIGNIDKFKIWDSTKFKKLFDDLTQEEMDSLSDMLDNA